MEEKNAGLDYILSIECCIVRTMSSEKWEQVEHFLLENKTFLCHFKLYKNVQIFLKFKYRIHLFTIGGYELLI